MMCLTTVYKKGNSIATTSRVFSLVRQKSQLARLILPLSFRRTVPAPRAQSKTCIQMNDSTENFFLCVPSIKRNVCVVCVEPNSKEMMSISLARCQEIFFFWKDRRGQGQVESTPLVFGIWFLVFLSCWFNKSLLCEDMKWGRYTSDLVEATNTGAAMVALTR